MCIFSKPSTNECKPGFILQTRFSIYILFHYILHPMILINLVHTEGSDIYVWCYLYGIDDVGCMTIFNPLATKSGDKQVFDLSVIN